MSAAMFTLGVITLAVIVGVGFLDSAIPPHVGRAQPNPSTTQAVTTIEGYEGSGSHASNPDSYWVVETFELPLERDPRPDYTLPPPEPDLSWDALDAFRIEEAQAQSTFPLWTRTERAPQRRPSPRRRARTLAQRILDGDAWYSTDGNCVVVYTPDNTVGKRLYGGAAARLRASLENRPS